MIVGTLRVRLALRDCHSLKEKRRVLNSLKERLSNTFNAAVAETELLDVWQSAELGMAVVGNETRHVNGMLSKIMDFVRGFPPVTVVDYQTETYGD